MTFDFAINSVAFISYVMLCFYVTSDKFYSLFLQYLERNREL